MAVDQDYVLGVAIQLQTQSVAEFEAQVRRQLEAIKPVKISTVQIPPEDNARLQRMLKEQEDIISQSEEKRKAANQKYLESWQQRTSSTRQQIDEETAIIKQKLDEQAAIIEAGAQKRKAAFRDLSNNGFGTGGTLIEGPDGGLLEKQQRVLDRYIPQLNAAAKAQSDLKSSIFATSDATDHLLKSMGNIATWSVGIAAVVGGGEALAKGFSDAIHSQQEQVIQGFYYRAQGQNFSPQMSNQTMQAAIELARKYGDDVMQVQEAIGLWAKSTHGELLPSIEMANEALKLNAVTGMKNEEIYRSTISVLSQYHEGLDKANNLYNIGVGLASKYGGGIKMLGGEAQDAARQMIEAMDTSSAVAASFGLSVEQAAGMATALIHAGNYDSGRSAGEAISRSLAALERGKPEAAMQKMGIALHNNSQILDELVQKWNQEVPGMGKSLGDVITSSVQSSALEPLKLMINQIGLVKQATKDAYDYEKSHPLEAMYSAMKDTDAYKLNQLKASFEAASIVIGRQFLPDIAKVADTLISITPAIANAAPLIADLGRGAAYAGIAFASWEGVKLVVGLVSTAAGQWGKLATAISGETEVAITMLTRQQREDIATLTNNATVTNEMAIQWQTLAAKQGVSVDAMIASMAQLKAQTQAEAAAIVTSEDAISANMAAVASQLGVEETEVATAFQGMATSAKSAAAEIGLAFIPVIGQVALFIGLVAEGMKAYRDFEDRKYIAENYADPNKRKSEMAKLLFHEGVVRQQISQLQSSGHTSGPYADILSNLQADLAHTSAMYHGLEVGPNGGLGVDIDKQLQATLAALKKDFPVPPGFTETGDSNPTDPKAAAQALDAQSQAVKRNVSSWASKIQADQKAIETARLETEYMKDHKKALDDLSAAYQKIISDVKSKIAVDEQALQKYEALASHAITEPKRQQYLNDANRIAGDLNNLRADLSLYQAKEFADMARQNLGAGSTMLGGYTRDARGVMTGLGSSANLSQLDQAHRKISDILSNVQYLEQAFKGTKLDPRALAEIETLKGDLTKIDNDATRIRDGLKSFLDTNTDTFQTGLSANRFEISNIMRDPSSKEFAKAIADATDKFDKFLEQWNKWESNAGDTTELENVKSLATAWYQSSVALAQYNQALAQAKASPAYAAITALGNNIGNTVTSEVMAGFNVNDQNQVYAIETQIAQLQNEKNLLTGQNNLVERNMLDSKIKRLEAERQGLEQRMQHPNFLKAVQEDMAKAVMKGLTDEFTKTLQQAFLSSILPKQETVQDKANAFIDANTTATQQNTQALVNVAAAIHGSSGVGSGGGFSLGGGVGLGTGFGTGGSSALSTAAGITTLSSGGKLPGGASIPSISVPSAALGGGSAALAGISFMNAAKPQLGSTSVYQPDPMNMGVNISSPTIAGGGNAPFWSNGKQNSQHIMGALAGLGMAKSGYDQGGVGGSFESGLGTFETLTSLGVPPQIAAPIAGVEFLFSLFHPHYNPSQNPDMFADSGYAQGIANAHGTAYTQATGWVNEDPGLKQQLGGMSQLQYLDAWYNAHPGGNGLNQQAKQLWTQIGTITGGGKGLDVRGLHQGNVYVSLDGVDQQVGISGNWQSVLSQIDDATNQLYALENEDLSGKGTWISVNSYGAGGGGSATFSPWSTPGLSSSDVSAVVGMPYPALNSNATVGTTIDPGSGSPSGGAGGGSYGGGGNVASPMAVTSNVYLNSDLIASQVNAFNIQRTSAGFAQNY